jgi:hypothetical protein
MAKAETSPDETSNGGIPTLFVVWLVCASAAIACFHFLPRPETANPGPREGFYRALTILALAGAAMVDAVIAACKTYRRRRRLSTAAKSLGYGPFLFTTGSVGTLLQQIFTE